MNEAQINNKTQPTAIKANRSLSGNFSSLRPKPQNTIPLNPINIRNSFILNSINHIEKKASENAL